MRYEILNQEYDYERENKIYESIDELDCFTYMFKIKATNKNNETREFDINFQADDRIDGLLENSIFFGDSGDESRELRSFFAGTEIYDNMHGESYDCDKFDDEEHNKALAILDELKAIVELEAEKIIKKLNSHFDAEQAEIDAEIEEREEEELREMEKRQLEGDE